MRLLRVGEMLVYITVTFEDIDHLQKIVRVAKEDDVSAKSEAANIGSKFRPWPAQPAGKRGKVPAFRSDAGDKAAPGLNVTAFL